MLLVEEKDCEFGKLMKSDHAMDFKEFCLC